MLSAVSHGCPFCAPEAGRVFLERPLVVGLWDLYPVTERHALLVTRRHVATWFDASDDERAALVAALPEVIAEIESRRAVEGYNVGFNAGEAAGQTVPHLHVHVIPRSRGDMSDPAGGVRHVIPWKGNYPRGAP